MTTVRGSFSLPQPLAPAARVRVQVLDTTLADVPATTVREATFVNPGRTDINGLRYSFKNLQLDPKHDYTLSAWVDSDADQQFSRGDLLTMQAYPIQPDAKVQVIDPEL